MWIVNEFSKYTKIERGARKKGCVFLADFLNQCRETIRRELGVLTGFNTDGQDIQMILYGRPTKTNKQKKKNIARTL